MRSKGWRSTNLDWLIDYACRDDYGTTAAQASAWAGIHYFACRFYDRRVAERYPSDTLTWPEGNAFLARGLARQIEPSDFRTNTLVAKIWREADGGRRLGIVDLQTDERETIAARSVVYAGKLHAARRVVVDLPPRQQKAISQLEYSPWLVAAISVREPPGGGSGAPAWDNVLFDSPATGYVVASHQNWDGTEAPTVLVYYLPFVDDALHSRRELLQRQPSHWANFILSDLTRAHPDLEGLVQEIEMYRWGHAMVRPRPGIVWGRGAPGRRAGHDGLFPASCDATGLPLFEEACFAGVLAAEGALQHLDAAFTTSLHGLTRV